MLTLLRKKFVNRLWERYCQHSPQAIQIKKTLAQKDICTSPLDHFAIIDLPGEKTGIPQLKEIFLTLGYIIRGQDYLEEKQNDFCWLAPKENMDSPAKEALPQVVIADFRLKEMPHEVRAIIEKYAQEAKPSPLKKIQKTIQQLKKPNEENTLIDNNPYFKKGLDILDQFFSGRDWSLPTLKEFHRVQEFNELLAWTLVYGRRPNHFTLSIHLLEHFHSFEDFLSFLTTETKIALNTDGGIIKGGKNTGIAQSSTIGTLQKIKLKDGYAKIRSDFVEFVWRYPCDHTPAFPIFWQDYFTGFIGKHANHVIESLYLSSERK